MLIIKTYETGTSSMMQTMRRVFLAYAAEEYTLTHKRGIMFYGRGSAHLKDVEDGSLLPVVKGRKFT